MLLVDRAGRIVMTNERLDEVFGYERGELLGRQVETLMPIEDRKRHPELRQAFAEYPAPRKMGQARDLPGLSKNGEVIPLEIGLTAYHEAGEDLVLAFVLDLTERKKQEEKFRLVADAATNGLLMSDLSGKIVLANEMACSMFGYQREELIGQPVELLIPERYRPKHHVYRDSYASSPESRDMGTGRDLFARRKDGSEFPVQIGLTPLHSHDRRFIVSTVNDITARKSVEAEIRAKNQELSRLNEELLSFAYSVSHDLKAPLLSIRGLADIAKEDLASANPDEARASLTLINDEAKGLAELIERVLDLAKSDHTEDSRTEVDLGDAVAQVLVMLEPLARQQGVRLASKVDSGMVVVTQPDRLQQVLENLVANGIKYSDSSKDERFVEISAEREESGVEVLVQDNGIGIPADCHDRVFGMFRRFHGQRADGSGLGLALVKKHVERLCGEIDFESSPSGTCFRVRLPGG